MSEILLIAAEWRLRALAGAQLMEEGYEVSAWPSLELAAAHLLHSGEPPRLTILDAECLEVNVQMVSELWDLAGRAPLILCGGLMSRRLLTQPGLPPAQLIMRPFCVGDVVEQVRRMLG